MLSWQNWKRTLPEFSPKYKDADKFQRDCVRTWGSASVTIDSPDLRTREQRILNAALGLNGEAGETGELIKKELFHEKVIPISRVAEEIGDTLYYAAALAHEYGLTLSYIMQLNQDKLAERYP